MISKARKVVQEIVRKFYYEHHDQLVMETDLTNAINSSHVDGSVAAKRRVVEALDYRINRLSESLEILKKNKEKFKSNYLFEDFDARIDELETFRHYVKGMVFKTDE